MSNVNSGRGVNYTGIDPARFWMALLSVELKHEDFTFIDFGSGKGRALLMASEFRSEGSSESNSRRS